MPVPITPAAALCTTGSWPNCGYARPHCPHRIRPVRCLLENQRDELLAFAKQLDQDLEALAAGIPRSPSLAVAETRQRAVAGGRPPGALAAGAGVVATLGSRYGVLREAVAELLGQVVRASSVIENLNSRLRSYFFLRRHLGADYLALLQFFLNHRRFVRSEHAERVGKSPAELLTGQSHPHWLELLGLHVSCGPYCGANGCRRRNAPHGERASKVRSVTQNRLVLNHAIFSIAFGASKNSLPRM